MALGYWNKILGVDLTNREITEEEIDDDTYRLFVGGAGIGAKILWLLFNEPERIPEPDTATQYIFDQGHLVGELAKRLFPDGVDIPTDDFIGNTRATGAK